MKIQTTSAENREQIANVRSQIRVTDDLKKFDSFLAKHEVIDFNDEKIAGEEKACCGGDNCCQNITIHFSAA